LLIIEKPKLYMQQQNFYLHCHKEKILSGRN